MIEVRQVKLICGACGAETEMEAFYNDKGFNVGHVIGVGPSKGWGCRSVEQGKGLCPDCRSKGEVI